MSDLNFNLPATDEVQVDAETLAAIDRGIEDADQGRTSSLEDARETTAQWISDRTLD
jgi:predicted transcriptional regulator